LAPGPNGPVPDENQNVDFAADWQRARRFDIAATQAHVAKNTIIYGSPVVDLGSAAERVSRSFARLSYLELEPQQD
jgi:hypothetical protein